MLTTKSI